MERQKPESQVHSGSTFDSFLEEERIRGEVGAVAIKRVIAWQLNQAMKAENLTKRSQEDPTVSDEGRATALPFD